MGRLLRFRALILGMALLACAACGGGSTVATTPSPNPTPNPNPDPNPNPNPPPGGGSTFPSFGHVVLLVEENHSYSEVIGNPDMPYLNSLATQYGLATQYYANAHPSIGNYFMLTTGNTITAQDDFAGTVSDDNLIRELVTAGKTWKDYADSLPLAGYTGGDVLPYSKHHNPFVYFTDVVGTSEANNVVPFSQLATDLAADQLPDFSYVVPDLNHDAHDGSLAEADTWLKFNIDPLVTSPPFQKDGLLLIVFDESESADSAHGGGHIAAVVVSPFAKKGYQSTTFFQHQSTLRLLLQALQIKTLPGAAAEAPEMEEFFGN